MAMADDGAGRPYLAAAVPDPSWVVIAPGGRRAYCVGESADGTVSALDLAEDGTARVIATRPSGGADPAHLALDPHGRFVVVANYTGGTIAVLPLREDGGLDDAVDIVGLTGGTPGSSRQEAPHPHCVAFDPVDGTVVVTDLGTDRVLVYDLGDDRRLHPLEERTIETPTGAGPRHVAFTRDGERLFVIGELDGMLYGYRRDGARFVDPVSAATRTEGAPESTSAALVLSADEQRLYVTNRGADSIAVHDARDPALRRIASVPAGGRTPRAATVTADGRMLVALQDSDAIAMFTLDADGIPRPSWTIAVPSPTCIAIAAD
jgi:6-phosphogluconolactonase